MTESNAQRVALLARVERVGAWGAVVGIVSALLGLAYWAGQIAQTLGRLRSDLSALEQYFLDYLVNNAQ